MEPNSNPTIWVPPNPDSVQFAFFQFWWACPLHTLSFLLLADRSQSWHGSFALLADSCQDLRCFSAHHCWIVQSSFAELLYLLCQLKCLHWPPSSSRWLTWSKQSTLCLLHISVSLGCTWPCLSFPVDFSYFWYVLSLRTGNKTQDTPTLWGKSLRSLYLANKSTDCSLAAQ